MHSSMGPVGLMLGALMTELVSVSAFPLENAAEVGAAAAAPTTVTTSEAITMTLDDGSPTSSTSPTSSLYTIMGSSVSTVTGSSLSTSTGSSSAANQGALLVVAAPSTTSSASSSIASDPLAESTSSSAVSSASPTPSLASGFEEINSTAPGTGPQKHVKVGPPPPIKCHYTEYGFYSEVVIVNLNTDQWNHKSQGSMTNREAVNALHKESKGCGKMTKWKFVTGPKDARVNAVTYRIPETFKKGCPARALHSAGAPELVTCHKHVDVKGVFAVTAFGVGAAFAAFAPAIGGAIGAVSTVGTTAGGWPFLAANVLPWIGAGTFFAAKNKKGPDVGNKEPFEAPLKDDEVMAFAFPKAAKIDKTFGTTAAVTAQGDVFLATEEELKDFADITLNSTAPRNLLIEREIAAEAARIGQEAQSLDSDSKYPGYSLMGPSEGGP